MKTKMKILSLFLILFMCTGIQTPKAVAQGGYVSYQVFYDDLSPYGTWVDVTDYGYVWVPDVAPGFTPYGTNGYWVYTDMGWTWVSNYPWGWAPFHYGRWYQDPFYGPIWIPGNEWGPGWVDWRQSNGYYGWAPMGPNGYYNDSPWLFVRNRDFGRTNIYNYYVDNSTNVTIINNSTVINNYRVDKSTNIRYNGGPDKGDVEKHGGRKVSQYTVTDNGSHGQKLGNNQLQTYRPQVQKNNSDGQKAAPSKVVKQQDMKSHDQKSATTPSKNANSSVKQQQNKQQPAQAKPTQQQNKQQPAQAKPTQQNKQQPAQAKPAQQQNKQQPAQAKPTQQQNKQQPAQTKPAQQQNKQQPAQTKPTQQQNKQQPARAKQSKSTQNKGGRTH